MKLQLADATLVAIKSCISTTTNVNGNTVNAIVFTVTGHSLESVKELFGKEANTAVIKVYGDEGRLEKTYDGYQVRKSVSITMVEDEYEVTMAQTSDVQERLKAIEKIVSDFTDTTNALSSVTSVLKENVKKIGEDLREKANKMTEQASTLESIQNAVDAQGKNVAVITKNTEDLTKVVNDAKTGVAEAVNAAQRAVQAVNDFASVANTANEAAAAARKAALDAETIVIANSEEFTAVKEASVASAKSSADLSDQFVIAGEKIKGFEEAVSGAKQETESCKLELSNVKKQQDDQNSSIGDLESRIINLEPISDFASLPLEEAKAYRVKQSADALAEYLAANPITSTVHDPKGAKYSITKEKQDRLAAMIAMTQMAESAGIEYQPSWNAAGEVCTYDWTLTELSTLAFEIEATVRPLVSHQQTIEKEIMAAKTMDELASIEISYNNIVANPLPAGLL